MKALYEQGLSFGKIADAVGLSRGQVQRRLIVDGVHVPRRKVRDGKVVCKSCDRFLPVTEFPTLRVCGHYVCRECKAVDVHQRQIGKLGCSKDQYVAMLESQNGECAICGTTVGHRSKNGVDSRLAVDHDHKTGQIRGLLCNACNRGLGRFKDSPNLLRAALRYLEGE